MSNHTQQEWRMAGRMTVYALDEKTMNNRFYAHVQTSSYRKVPLEELEANARLIAAAPLMLHELYAAAAQIEALGGDSSTQRAAIATAEGSTE